MSISMFQVPVRIGQLPLGLLCRWDATVALFPSQQFKAFVDIPSESGGVFGVFDMDGFKLDNEEYDYQTAYSYKTIPKLLKWLQQQEMPMPDFNKMRK